MAENASPSLEAFSDQDTYWSSLTDDQLTKVVWTTTDPARLENLVAAVPETLPSFIIELSYDLDSKLDTPVACGHCPQHQKHWRGYVLKAATGERYLLGSACGPKAYGADYSVASKSRKAAEKRANALTSWAILTGEIANAVDHFSEVQRGEAYRVLRRARRTWENQSPRTLETLRKMPRDSLTGLPALRMSQFRRDLAAEAKRDSGFLAEALRLADLPNKQHREAMEALKKRTGSGPIMVPQDFDFGLLTGADWLLSVPDPFKRFEDGIQRLRSYLAVGRSTQDKPTSRLVQLIHASRTDLEQADHAIEVFGTAPNFFQPNQLSALAAWYRGGNYRQGRLRSEGCALHVTDGSASELTLQLPPAWVPPLDRMSRSTKKGTR